MQKLYCYVDETGQDTQGKIFLVSVIIPQKEREELRKKLETIENNSKRGERKWFHTNKVRREAYIKQLIESNLFKDSIFYSQYRNSKAYLDLTILTAAKAILKKARMPYETIVFVDALRKSDCLRFSAGLRNLKVKVRKVRGLNDQSDAFIRLADAISGFVRDYLEGNIVMEKLYKTAVKNKIIKEI